MIQRFWKKIIEVWQNVCDWFIAPFPSHYHPKCFDCNLGPEDCPACEYRTWEI